MNKIFVAVVVKKNRRVLWVKRREDQSFPNQWVLPGGKIEYGESWVEAAARELLEETGVLATKFVLLGVTATTGEGWDNYLGVVFQALDAKKLPAQKDRSGVPTTLIRGPEQNHMAWFQQGRGPRTRARTQDPILPLLRIGHEDIARLARIGTYTLPELKITRVHA